MISDKKNTIILEDSKINIKLKLSALWVTIMFCFIYADILGFYDKDSIDEIMKGNMGFLGPVTQGLMLGSAVLMSIPGIMVFISISLKPKVNRLLNIIFAALFGVITLITIVISYWYYYVFFGIVEISLIALIIKYAWKWPIQEN